MNDYALQSPLTRRELRHFQMAFKAAGESDFRVKVGCAAYIGDKLIATGCSQNKTHPMQQKFNVLREFDRNGQCCLDKIHAEMKVLTKLRTMDIRMSDVTIYVVRICKARPFGLARPCRACLVALSNAGIRDVRYTTDFQGYAREWIGDRKLT